MKTTLNIDKTVMAELKRDRAGPHYVGKGRIGSTFIVPCTTNAAEHFPHCQSFTVVARWSI